RHIEHGTDRDKSSSPSGESRCGGQSNDREPIRGGAAYLMQPHQADSSCQGMSQCRNRSITQSRMSPVASMIKRETKTVGVWKKRWANIKAAPTPPPPAIISAVNAMINATGTVTRTPLKICGLVAGKIIR